METDSALWMVKEKIADGRIIMGSSESAGMNDRRCWSRMMLLLVVVGSTIRSQRLNSFFVTDKEMSGAGAIGLS